MENRLILSTRRVQTPLYIEELGLAIYTIEELCYYIYHYLEFIDDKFINDEFLGFIGKVREFGGMSDKIIRWINSGSDLGQILFMIQQDVHYLNGSELNDLKARIDWMRTAAPADRLKKKADLLVTLKKYHQAIIIYDDLLEKERTMGLSLKMKGKLLHNRGVAESRLFMFGEAAESFSLAYSLLGSEDILKEIYFLQFLDKKAVGEPECMCEADDGIRAEWKTEINRYMEAAVRNEDYEKISDAANYDYYRKSSYFYDLIIQWKNEYRNMVK